MRAFAVSLLVSFVLGLGSHSSAADSGYEASARWWGEIEASAQRVDDVLRALYVEAAVRSPASNNLVREVDRLLKERYPGGSYVVGQYGRLVFNASNYAEFSGGSTRSLVARFGDTVRRYDLPEQQFTITHRGHSLAARIRPSNPAGSRFVAPANLPAWVEEAAAKIVGQTPTVFTSPFVELLNRVYDQRLAATGQRLDQLAESLLGGGEPVERVLTLGRELYEKKP